MDDLTLARAFYRSYEQAHAAIYFFEGAARRYSELGVTSRGGQYFGSRSAPLGRASKELVFSTFYSFSMRSIERAIPDTWEIANPDDLVAARFEAAEELFQPALNALGESKVDQLISQLQRAVATLELGGRPLYAAHASLDDPRGKGALLWHNITLLRENRGDGHISCLTAEEVSGVEANIIHIASGRVPKEFITNTRGFSDDEWNGAIKNLRDRELLKEDDSLTPSGESLKNNIEESTDRLSLGAVSSLGSESSDVIESLTQVTKAIKEAHKLPF
ncbi:MAG: hypothetical protein M0Z45_09040 [Actinomycetota bacterium]|nr:hypothetical protein [Actinomycetota bacterium]